MKRISLMSQSLFAASLGVTLMVTAVSAQTVSADLSTAAKDACTRSAESKGFTVKEVVSVEPKAGATDGATVVLNLDKAGQLYKLTCGYSASTGASIDDSSSTASTMTAPATTTTAAPTTTTTTTTTTATAPTFNYSAPNLAWLLLPLIGLPLLLALFRGRDKDAVGYATRTERLEGLVRNRGRALNVHSGPAAHHSVTETLRDGQRILLSGRQQDGWVELAEGGWVSSEALDLDVRHSVR